MSTRFQKTLLVSITVAAIAVLASASSVAARPVAGFNSHGGVAGLFPPGPPAGLFTSGQGNLYNMGRPGTTVCGMGRCNGGGVPAGLFRR
jgi:hypothetical protein